MNVNTTTLCARIQEICFYNIPTEKESKAGAKPELLKSFPSGHEELVTKILLLDVDRVRRHSQAADLGNRIAWLGGKFCTGVAMKG